jgi:hypothetical protein
MADAAAQQKAEAAAFQKAARVRRDGNTCMLTQVSQQEAWCLEKTPTVV